MNRERGETTAVRYTNTHRRNTAGRVRQAAPSRLRVLTRNATTAKR